MSKTPEQLSQKEAREICLQELDNPRLRGTTDPKKHPYARAYRALDTDLRRAVSNSAADHVFAAFNRNERIDTLLYLICVGFTSDSDWEAVSSFLDKLLSISGDVAFFREMAISLLEISDTELSDPTSKLPIAEAALVVLTEFGLLLANQKGESALDAKAASHVVEYISTSLLARSNVNSTSMRIALVHFLSSCEMNRQSTLQLNRVISRFGHSLLDELLRAFFDDKKKITAAFFFLVEHLSSFFSASPKLAEMSHEVLKHYMLKYPDDFPHFLASYVDALSSDKKALILAHRHFTLLFKSAIDVNQRKLTESIGHVILKMLSLFKEDSVELMHEQLDFVYSVLRSGGGYRGPRMILLQDFITATQAMVGNQLAAKKIVSLSRAKKSRDQQVKLARVGTRPSPLDSMISLAG